MNDDIEALARTLGVSTHTIKASLAREPRGPVRRPDDARMLFQTEPEETTRQASASRNTR